MYISLEYLTYYTPYPSILAIPNVLIILICSGVKVLLMLTVNMKSFLQTKIEQSLFGRVCFMSVMIQLSISIAMYYLEIVCIVAFSYFGMPVSNADRRLYRCKFLPFAQLTPDLTHLGPMVPHVDIGMVNQFYRKHPWNPPKSTYLEGSSMLRPIPLRCSALFVHQLAQNNNDKRIKISALLVLCEGIQKRPAFPRSKSQ